MPCTALVMQTAVCVAAVALLNVLIFVKVTEHPFAVSLVWSFRDKHLADCSGCMPAVISPALISPAKEMVLIYK